MNHRYSILLALGAFFFGAPCQARATPQMPFAVLIKTNGSWRFPGGYLRGAGIEVQNGDAQTKAVLYINAAIPERELACYWTSAGPAWGDCCLWYFTKLGERSMFRARTRYGTDILIDLEAARFVPAQEYRGQFVEMDKEQITSALATADQVLRAANLTSEAEEQVNTALLQCGLYSMTNCVPFLRQLESSDDIGMTMQLTQRITLQGTGRGRYSYSQQPPLDQQAGYWHYTVYEVRRLAALALRRVGEVPRGFPAIGFLPQDRTTAVGADVRRAHQALLQAGQTPSGVYELLGAPDYIEDAEECCEGPWKGTWRYDIDGQVSCTLLVIWDERGTLSKIERITPPLWQGDSLMSDDSVKPVFNSDGSIRHGAQLYGGSFRGRIKTLLTRDSLAEPDQEANRTPPIRLETNQPTPATGARR